MIKLSDNNKMVGITMFFETNGHNGYDFSNDFFGIGGLEYDEECNAYRVDDVDYCVEMAQDWENARGDFATESKDGVVRHVYIYEEA